MTAATLKSWRPTDRTSDAADLTPLVVGGWLFGMFATGIAIVLDLIVLVSALAVTGVSETGNRWPDAGIALFAVAVVAISLVVGRWAYRFRQWIGTKGDPMDHDTMMRKRRAFTVNSMFIYVLLSPVVWLLMLALALSP